VGYTTLEALLAAKPEDLTSIEGIADTMARTIVSGLAERREEMLALLASGAITIRKPTSTKAGQEQTLSGLSFCFTGELSSMKRAEAEKLVRDLGGVTKSSVTKGLNYLVTNDPNSGSEKNTRARELGIPIYQRARVLVTCFEASSRCCLILYTM